MENFPQLYSKERLQQFITKYKDLIQLDPLKEIHCGIIHLDELHIAAQLLHQGELVAFPTETVYGLGANAKNAQAILNIFKAKRRPLSDPLIVHVHDKNNIYTDKPDFLDSFAELFWPGPFTIVLKSTQLETTEILSAGTGSIGIRIPNHKVALELLEKANLPIAAPSANLFTHISPTSAAHVFNDFYDQRVHIIDADRSDNGIESTVIKPLGNELHILRLGSLAKETIIQKIGQSVQLKHFAIKYENKYMQIEENEEELEKELENLQNLDRKNSMEAPGQFLKHYSARINSFIVTFQQINIGQEIDLDLKESVIIDFGQELRNRIVNIDETKYKSLSINYDAKEAMFNLYDSLRWAELQQGAKQILLYDFDTVINQKVQYDENILSIQDKIFRSASGQKIYYKDNKFYLCQ
ncbi:unnamed protein product [Paramecium pentaurelia]|uniref:Threonylcarbamoyl-AMP synthase n=1 Tax=Paramecium pentaurelia TaxID=43138 RepID=A0A8S1XZM3_9CILI|nr:unnamed protein product [Paramecium pentaurelia]